MIIFQDNYSFSFDSRNSKKKGRILSCHLTIIDFSRENINLFYLKPFVIFVRNTTRTPSRTTCIETMGRRIFEDFELEVKKTLWIEYDPMEQQKIHVAQISPKYFDGMETIFSVNWRKIMIDEKNLIAPFIKDIFEIEG